MAFTFSLQNDVATLYDALLQMFKTTKLAMDIVASGDGDAIYDTIGSDIFTNGTNGSGIPGNIANPNAWVLWNSRGGNFQCLWRRNIFTGYSMGVYISPGSNFSLAGTSATVSPATATDETELTPLGGSVLIVNSGSGNNEPITINAVIGDIDEDYSFFVFNVIQGMRLSSSVSSGKTFSGLYVDFPVNTEDDPMDLRAVFATPNANHFFANNEIYDSTSSNERGSFPLCYTEGILVPARGVGLVTPVRSSNAYALAENERDSDWTGKPWGFDGAVWWSNPHLGRFGKSKVIGRSRLFKPIGCPCGPVAPYHDTWGFSAAQDRAYVAGVSIPWDPGAADYLI